MTATTQHGARPAGRRITLDDIPEAAGGAEWALREQAKPHYALAGLTLAGAAVHAISAVTGQPATVSMAVALIVVAVTLAVRRLRRRWRIALAAATWLVWIATLGLGWETFAAMVTTGYALALRHWRQHRIPIPPEDEPEPEPDDTTSYPMLWGQNIADGGPLPETYLSNEREIKTGLRYDLYLRPGKQSLKKAMGALPELRTGLRLLPRQDLVVERHPKLDEAVLSVTIVRESKVLTEAQLWPGGTYNPVTGMIYLGPYVDGEGIACWKLHTEDSLWGGFVAGSIGSGKSRALEAIALGASAAGCAIWFIDGQDGASSSFLKQHADWYAAGIKDVLEMLRVARRVKKLRQMQNDLNGWDGWSPEQGRPGVLIIIDECHVPLMHKEIQAAVTEIAREGRKVGVAAVLASQVAQQDVFGKNAGSNAEALRSSICKGNMLIMQSATYSTAGVLPGVNFDPTLFPDIPGYAMLVDQSNQRRSAPLRCYFLPKEVKARVGPETTWHSLEVASAGVGGPTYLNRREAAALRRQQQVAELAALQRGEELDDLWLDEPLPTPPAAALGGDGFEVVRFPDWADYAEAFHAGLGQPTPAALPRPATTPAVSVPDGSGRRTAVDVVFGLVSKGVSSPSEIQARSGYGETAVRNALKQLAEEGRVRNRRHGVWEPAREMAAQGASQ